MKTKRPHNFIDMTGWIMKEHGVENSKWTVIEYKGNRKWLCRCECGNEKEVDGASIRRGISLSCGKCKDSAPNTINELGKTYGYLTVIGESKELTKDKHKQWICKCKCGNIIIVPGKSLRSGHTRSCGCLHKEVVKEQQRKDITGQRFGKLIALETIGQNKNGNFIWKCQCDCGNITTVTTHNLCYGNTNSCGCLKSKGEQKIKSILQENNINYKSQYYFSDLYWEGYLRFDFAIFIDNKLHCLIEYQGIQHYQPIDFFKNSQKQWQRDQEKREYCKKNNILLVEIPYTDFDKIDYDYIKEKCNL